jgi:V8-like Glu-specific endopeptidase
MILIGGCGEIDSPSNKEFNTVHGENDLIPVKGDGSNIPQKYRPLLDAIGLMDGGCTVTHLGNGIAITAGHCFLGYFGDDDVIYRCNHASKWGYRQNKNDNLTSNCEYIMARKFSDDGDYAILRVAPIPPVKIAFDAVHPISTSSVITIFSHPKRRPLEWSQYCSVESGKKGGKGPNYFTHQCDTEGGSSGAPVIDDTMLKIVGIHNGGNDNWNHATYLSATSINKYLGSDVALPPLVSFLIPTEQAKVKGPISVAADAMDPDGFVEKVIFEFPDGTRQEITEPPYVALWDSTQVSNGTYMLHALAYDDQGLASKSVSLPIAVINDR